MRQTEEEDPAGHYGGHNEDTAGADGQLRRTVTPQTRAIVRPAPGASTGRSRVEMWLCWFFACAVLIGANTATTFLLFLLLSYRSAVGESRPEGLFRGSHLFGLFVFVSCVTPVSAMQSMARLMLRPTYCLEAARHISSALALAIARILPAAEAFRIERLRHFGILVAKANSEMWALLHHERQWLMQVQDDIAWLSDRLQQAGQPHSEISSWEAAVDIITDRPRRWKRLIKSARGSALLAARWEAEKQQFYGLLLRQLRAAGAALPAYPEAQKSQ